MPTRTTSSCHAFAIAVLGAVSGCAVAPAPMTRTDIAILEAGDARIARIDGIVFDWGNGGAFDLRPGGHTIEISGVWIRPDYSILPVYEKMSGSLCLKARGGRRYRIKHAIIDARRRIFIIDTATGESPRTPCGPDEDDD
jgi:hypothetical protein